MKSNFSMVYKTLILLIYCGLLFIGCKKDRKTEVIFEYPMEFPFQMYADTVDIDSLIEKTTVNFQTQLEGKLAEHNSNKSKIKSARLVFMQLKVPVPVFYDSNTYSNLKDISEIMLDIRQDQVGQMPVAHKTTEDKRTMTLNMDLLDTEIKDYIMNEYFSLVIKYRKRRPIYHTMPFSISFRFRIVAEQL